MAVIGTTIFYLDGTAYNSPEFGRGGLAATFVIDVTHLVLGTSVEFDVEVEHRNHDDIVWGSAGTFTGITAAAAYPKDITGLKEVVRFKYSFSGGTPIPSEAAHFFMQAPTWRPY